MRTSIKKDLNNLHLSDIYSLILFIMYKIQDLPEYAILSELCYLLDGANLTRLLTYFAGKQLQFLQKKNLLICLMLCYYTNM